METKIERMDHLGNGIGYINNKVVFVPKTITGDIVDIKIIKDSKTYSKGEVLKYLKRSNDYVKKFCPYYNKCGGCNLQNFNYDKTLEYKKDRLINILNKLNITNDIKIIKNNNPLNYRNKIELKIVNDKIGYYEMETHNLCIIDKCLITKECINDFIKEIPLFNIHNGDIILRCNYNNELLIIINSNDIININEDILIKHKVVGVIKNNETIYGENHFIEIINNLFFEVSYDSFMQVNSYINSKLFDIIKDNVKNENVLDLYSGVGTLSIVASKSANKVYSIEIIENAIINSLKNAKMNNSDNINFILGKVEDKILMINDHIDTVIIDPPRGGIKENVINKILELMPNKIIFISCETQKFSEDVKKFLNDYSIKDIYLLDMFSYTYHLESICILERSNLWKYIQN